MVLWVEWGSIDPSILVGGIRRSARTSERAYVRFGRGQRQAGNLRIYRKRKEIERPRNAATPRFDAGMRQAWLGGFGRLRPRRFGECRFVFAYLIYIASRPSKPKWRRRARPVCDFVGGDRAYAA